MTTKLLIITSTILLFTACSQIDYKGMYDNQTNIFDLHMQTQGENEQNSIQRGENPISRPTYDEYRESIEDKKLNSSTLLP